MSFHPGGTFPPLGAREHETLALIASLTRDLGRGPTIPEIAARLRGTPRTAVYGRVGELRRKRFVALERRGQRAGVLMLTAAGRQLVSEGNSGIRRAHETQEVQQTMDEGIITIGEVVQFKEEVAWNADAARRLQEQSAERIDSSRPVQFLWKTTEGRDGGPLQDRILRVRMEGGDAVAAEDLGALMAALAEVESIFLVAFEDFRAVAEVEKCPKCQAWPPGSCGHTDPSASYVSRPDAYGHGGTGGDRSWMNRQLRDTLLEAGQARRAELTATRAQRISERKAEIIMDRMLVEVRS